MINIPIDWTKASKYPENSQKVDGKYLLELKIRINELERTIENLNLKLHNSQNTENELREELKINEEELNRLDNLIKYLKTKTNLSKALIEDMQTRLSNKDLQIKNLEKYLIANINQNYDIAHKLKNLARCLDKEKKNENELNRVKQIIKNKGFITEKEFETIMGKKSLEEFLIRN